MDANGMNVYIAIQTGLNLMGMIKIKRILSVTVIVSMMTAVFYVQKTITYVEDTSSTTDGFNYELNGGIGTEVEYIIVNLINYKVRFLSDSVFQYDKTTKELSSKTQNLILKKTPIGYWSIYEITQKQFENVMGYNPSFFRGRYYMTRPVENVSRNEATAFISKIRHNTGLSFRLPSKTEWIRACLAGDDDVSPELMFKFGRISTNTPRSEELKAVNDWKYYLSFGLLEAWLRNMTPCYAGTQFVGSYIPNTWGLYDMHGNVMEWTTTRSRRERIGILMGGSWMNSPKDCAATREWPNGIDNWYSQTLSGFRVILSGAMGKFAIPD